MALFSTPSHPSTDLSEEQNASQKGSWEQHVLYCTKFVETWVTDYRKLESLRSSQAEMGEINELQTSLKVRVAECSACAKKYKSVGTEKEEMMRNGFITMGMTSPKVSFTPLPVWHGVVAKPVQLLDIPMSVVMLAYQLEHGFDRPAGEPPFMSLVCGYYENLVAGVSPEQFFEWMELCTKDYFGGVFQRQSEFMGLIVNIVDFSEVAMRVAIYTIVPGQYIVEYNRYYGEGFGYVTLVTGFKSFCTFHRLFVSSRVLAELPPYQRPRPVLLSGVFEYRPLENPQHFVSTCLANDISHLAQNILRPEVRQCIASNPSIMRELFESLQKMQKPEHYYGWGRIYCTLYIFEKIFEERRDLVQEGLVSILEVVEKGCKIPEVLECVVRLRSVV